MVQAHPPRGAGCAGSEIGANPGFEPVAQRDPAPLSSEPDGWTDQDRRQGGDRGWIGWWGSTSARRSWMRSAWPAGAGSRWPRRQGVAELTAWLQPGSLVVMEASGGYERLVHRLLLERGIRAAIVNARGCASSPSGGPAGQDRSARCRGDRQLRRLRQAGADAGAGLRARRWPRPWPSGSADPPEDVSTADSRRQLLAEITARTLQLAQLRTPSLIARARAALQRLRQDKAELDRLLQGTIGLCPIPRRDVSAVMGLPCAVPGSASARVMMAWGPSGSASSISGEWPWSTIGIDVSLKQSSVCVVDATGKIVHEAKIAAEPRRWSRSAASSVSWSPGSDWRPDRSASGSMPG